jgi:PPP family 3-phenylpropionic acid transporter
VIYFFAYASWAAWWPLFTIYLQNAGLSGVQTGLVSSIAPVMMFIVQPVWGVIADRYGRKRLLVLALILSALSLVAYLWITGFWPILILTVIFSLFLNPVYPVVDTLALDSLGKDKEFGFGYLRMWGAVGWLTGAFLAGQITGEQDVVTVFPLSAVLLGLACLFAFRVRTVKEVKGTLDMSWQNWLSSCWFSSA